VKRVKVINLGLRDSMSGSQILAELSKQNWVSFVLAGYMADESHEEGHTTDGDELPPVRLNIQYHPDTEAEEAIVLGHLVIAECTESIRGE